MPTTKVTRASSYNFAWIQKKKCFFSEEAWWKHHPFCLLYLCGSRSLTRYLNHSYSDCYLSFITERKCSSHSILYFRQGLIKSWQTYYFSNVFIATGVRGSESIEFAIIPSCHFYPVKYKNLICVTIDQALQL